ncbi:hypothetical protein LCGC14_2237850 [marine sediment metagenome]|uniref:Uncharacterized protein n=1 Tax=marine sediment metagenome TaxID=412755 RepID=A0A0F9G1D0_9ZZZZ
MKKKITVKLDIQKIVRITGNHGGYETGECLLCEASGWLEGEFGSPYSTKDTGADLVHKKNCLMNKVLA